MPGEAIIIPPFEAARFTLEHDLYNGEQTLRVVFFPSQYYCIGFLLFHFDGSSFAEYHPDYDAEVMLLQRGGKIIF